MSEVPARVTARFFLADPDASDPGSLIPVFHDWIRRGDVLDGLLIDVADYHHVPDGPGVLLIGHEWDRAVAFDGDRPAVVSVSKRGLEGDLAARVQAVVADALTVAAALEDDPAVSWARVALDQVEIGIPDRLFAPNTPEVLGGIGDDIAGALAPLNDGAAPALEQLGDTRRPFRVRASLSGALGARDAADALRAVVA